MKKLIGLLLPALLTVLTVSAQNLTQTIRGRVIDRESQQPMVGATVVVLTVNPPIGVTAGPDGSFRIPNVPVGRHTLKITSIGYEEMTLPEVLLGSGKEMVLNLGLSEAITTLDEAVVVAEREKGTARNEMATVSARSISVEESKRFAASAQDPARTAQTFAGVTAAGNDITNEIVVRGNSPRGLLWRIEGVEVPNPNHFSEEGASGGGISALSTNVLANSDFFTGAFPAEYGNALSGVFDVKLRTGNNEKREYAFQAGVLGVDFAVEGPLRPGGKASYLANYRYSSLALLKNLGVDVTGDNGVPKYQDLSFKINAPTRHGNLTFWGVGGLSSTASTGLSDSTNWKRYFDRFDQKVQADVGMGGLTYTHFLSDRAYLETTVSATGNRNGYRAWARTGETGANDKVLDADQRFVSTSVRGQVLYHHKLDARNTIRTGLIVSRNGFEARNGYRSDDYGGRFVNFLDRTGALTTVQAYGQWKYRASEKLTFTGGLHALHLTLNGRTSVEPRAGMRWALSATQALTAGVGLHSRTESPFVYYTRLPLADGTYAEPNKNLRLARAAHYVVGYDHQLTEDLRLRAEAYYQSLFDLAISPNPRSALALLNTTGGTPTDTLVSRGRGRNFGLDLTLEKFFTGRYYYQLTSSVYDSRYRAADGQWRNTRFNGHFVLNVLAGKEIKVGSGGNNLIGLNVRALWSGGNRYTPVDLAASRRENRQVNDEARAWREQAPNYYRLDLRVSYRKNKPHASHVISLDLQNATNRANIYGRFYDRYSQKVETAYQTGLLPILNYRVEF